MIMIPKPEFFGDSGGLPYFSPPFKVTSPEWISCSMRSNTKVTATIREDQVTQAIRSNVSLKLQKKYVSNFQG